MAIFAEEDNRSLRRFKPDEAYHFGEGVGPITTDLCAAAGIIFIGLSRDTMRRLGDKVSARQIAEKAKLPVVPATEPLP